MNALVLVGRIASAHGIRGAVKLKSFTADPKAIASYGALQTRDGRSIEILHMKATRDGFIADLRNVKDRTTAETLKAQDLYVSRESLPPLKDGEVYLVDLLQQDAFHKGVRLGTIIGIENYGAGDLLEIDQGLSKTLLVPARFMKTVEGKVTLDLPEGFLESLDQKAP